MSTMKIKKGDMVKVIAGKDKDKEGKVIAVDKKDGRAHKAKHGKPERRNRTSGRLH